MRGPRQNFRGWSSPPPLSQALPPQAWEPTLEASSLKGTKRNPTSNFFEDPAPAHAHAVQRIQALSQSPPKPVIHPRCLHLVKQLRCPKIEPRALTELSEGFIHSCRRKRKQLPHRSAAEGIPQLQRPEAQELSGRRVRSFSCLAVMVMATVSVRYAFLQSTWHGMRDGPPML